MYTYSTDIPSAPISHQNDRLSRFASVVRDYEISEKMALYLRKLERFDIVVIADDSGSMLTPLTPISSTSPSQTRWDELKGQVQIITKIATCLDSDGIDLYFLNRSGLNNVTETSQIDQLFSNPPRGYTPLTRVLRQAISDKHHVINDPELGKSLLVIIITDGQPTTDDGYSDIKTFLSELNKRPDNVHVSIVACTDDDRTLEYLNTLDDNSVHLDVVDDYVNERKEILEAQGSNFPFSYGDYVVKILCGSIVKELDELDSRKGTSSSISYGSECCVFYSRIIPCCLMLV
ncbi:hypothetical protein GEMRC1_013199 [Eukaryota sp. GEM-RC1]